MWRRGFAGGRRYLPGRKRRDWFDDDVKAGARAGAMAMSIYIVWTYMTQAGGRK